MRYFKNGSIYTCFDLNWIVKCETPKIIDALGSVKNSQVIYEAKHQYLKLVHPQQKKF